MSNTTHQAQEHTTMSEYTTITHTNDLDPATQCAACDTQATHLGDDGEMYCSEHVGMGGDEGTPVYVVRDSLGVAELLTREEMTDALAEYIDLMQGGEDVPADFSDLLTDVALFVHSWKSMYRAMLDDDRRNQFGSK